MISACMIVKNEEKNLERCLASVKPLVDEIVIIDTGSTDGSMAIAERFGAVIFQEPWQDDFSLHRNQSIAVASHDFVLIVDADEELVCRDPKSFRQELAELSLPFSGLAVDMHDVRQGAVMNRTLTSRVFRRDRIRYEGIVHNKPVVSEGQVRVTGNLILRHYGYDLTKKEWEVKNGRLLRLLTKRLENPDDYEAHFYMSQVLAGMGQHVKAMTHCEKYIACREKAGDKFHKSAYYTAVKTANSLGNEAQSWALLTEAINLYPDFLDFRYLAVQFGIQNSQHALVRENALAFCRIFMAWTENPALRGNEFLFNFNMDALAFVNYHAGMMSIQSGMNFFRNVMEAFPYVSEDQKKALVVSFPEDLKKTGMPDVTQLMRQRFAERAEERQAAGSVAQN